MIVNDGVLSRVLLYGVFVFPIYGFVGGSFVVPPVLQGREWGVVTNVDVVRDKTKDVVRRVVGDAGGDLLDAFGDGRKADGLQGVLVSYLRTPSTHFFADLGGVQ